MFPLVLAYHDNANNAVYVRQNIFGCGCMVPKRKIKSLFIVQTRVGNVKQ